MSNFRRIIIIIIILALGGTVWSVIRKTKSPVCPFLGGKDILRRTWEGYKHFFITPEGRVVRPKEHDTVSEGQAYAMLRAVWMNDHETFDRCYRWTEDHLSRMSREEDHLLAWHWQDGQVTDRMPASDADIDYALSLILADALWGTPGQGLPVYQEKARAVLNDIMEKLTFATDSGRRYLAPWLLGPDQGQKKFPQNPSYYSPAHFRIFFMFTGDQRWKDLVDTTYVMIDNVSRFFDGQTGVGLVPDWCQVDREDQWSRLEGKNPDFGWDAVRLPLRVLLDDMWFKEERSTAYLKGPLAAFIKNEWQTRGKIYCEYALNGQPKGEGYENPLFYSLYGLVMSINDSGLANAMFAKVRCSLKTGQDFWVYQDENEYYVNSLAWLSEAVPLGIIRNYFRKR